MICLSRLLSVGVASFLVSCSTLSGGPFGSAGGDELSVSGSYLQGRFAAQAFDIPKAEEAFEVVAREWQTPQANRTAFGYALASGDMAEAERLARIMVSGTGEEDDTDTTALGAIDPGIAADLPRLTLAATAMRDGDSEAAVAQLSAPLQSSLGQALGALMKSAAAYDAIGIDAATKAISEQPEDTFRGLVPLHAAILFELEGQPGAAEAAYRQALGAPRAEIAALGLARLLEEVGRGQEAEPIYSRMMQDAGLYSRAGRMGLVRIGALENEPRAFAKRANRAGPVADDAKALFALALENFAWLGFEQAVSIQDNGPGAEQRRSAALVVPLGLAHLARAVDPDRDVAHYLAALIFGSYETPEPSIEAARKIAPENWLYGYAQLEISNMAAAGGDTEEAIRVLKDAVRGDGGPSPQWALQLSILLAADERPKEADVWGARAITVAERLGVLPSSLWRYYFARGAARLEAGSTEGAFADLEKALELAPDEPVVLNHLGYSYVERGEQLERAFGMIERALELDPNNGAIVDSLGWAHFQRGNYRQAIPYLEQAVELEPADAVITDHLGDAYYMVGRERDARYEWQRVLPLDDGDDELKEGIRSKLRGDFSDAPVLAERDER